MTGYVLEWDPPHKLVLTWQLRADWQFDEDFQTEVEVKFTPVDGSGTLVSLTHMSLENYADKADEMRSAVGGEGGWPLALKQYAEAAAN